jgi:hypothetical protein
MQKRRFKLRPRIGLALITLLLMGKACEVDVTDPNVAAAVTDLNAIWRTGYNEVLHDLGTRRFAIDRASAATAMRQAMEKLGLQVASSEGDYYLHMSAPAPLPLDEREWLQARQEEEPAARQIIAKHMGAVKANFFTLQPEGLNSDLIFTFLEAGDGVSISVTYRTREIKPQPPESILPRRDYPPPGAARIGLEKIWRHFEEIALPLAKMSARR